MHVAVRTCCATVRSCATARRAGATSGPMTTIDERSPVTVIGLGSMGRALAAAFLAAGHPTTVWNRSAGRADELVAKGATRAATAVDAAAASPLAIVCLLDHHAVHEVLETAGATLAGRAVINLTSGTPAQARRTAAWAIERGVDYLDGGIMAIPPGIGTSHAFVLYSGAAAVFERHRRSLEALGAATYVGADPGLASLLDVALLTAMYGMLGGAVHAIALAGTEKIAAGTFTSTLLLPWLTAMAGAIPDLARQIETGAYAIDAVASLRMQAAAFGHLVQTSVDQGIRADLMLPLQALVERRVADGHGDDDFSGIIELLRGRP